ncbi:MAG: ribonuclease P protein component [Firmicutes bacterium]|nr:ribonuclease P protein component [Bacillota bacterium]
MLPARYRLRRRNDFDRVYRRGVAKSCPAFVLYCKRNGGQATRIGFSVSKKFGKAVRRNRIKRQLRAAAAEQMAHFRRGCDYILVVRRAAAEYSYQQLSELLSQLVRSLEPSASTKKKPQA